MESERPSSERCRSPVPPALLEDLRAVVGTAHVLTDPALTASYDQDWTGRWTGCAAAVVRPASGAEVAGVVRACAAHRTPIVPQGGNTGLVGGSIARHGEVVLSTRRLDALGPVDALSGQVTVGAGATLAAVSAHAAAAGWRVPVDLGARTAATIGGMVATNAGGNQVLRFGTMRASVVGVELVTGTGAVVSHLGGLAKDNTGYPVAALVTGSEGTLGVVTAVRLQLVAPAPEPVTVAVGLPGLEAALALLAEARCAVTLEAAEFVLAEGAALVGRELGVAVPEPFRSPVGLLFELGSDGAGETERLAGIIGRLAPDAPVAVAVDGWARAALWAVRERHTEAVSRLGPPLKLDVSLPFSEIGPFCAQMIASYPDVVLFGHLGDGNVHVNLPGRGVDEVVAAAVEAEVLAVVASRGGSISAEHGIGTAKRDHLHLVRSAEELALFRAVKAAFDPLGICHPHALLPPA